MMWQIRLLYAVALGESVLPCLPSQEITFATQRHPNRCESTRCCIVMPIMEIKKKNRLHRNGYVRIDRHFRHPISSRIRSFSSIPVHSLLLSPTFAIKLGTSRKSERVFCQQIRRYRSIRELRHNRRSRLFPAKTPAACSQARKSTVNYPQWKWKIATYFFNEPLENVYNYQSVAQSQWVSPRVSSDL